HFLLPAQSTPQSTPLSLHDALPILAIAQEAPKPADKPAAKPAEKKRALPLKPTRKIEFTTDEATWLSLDVAPDGKTIELDLPGRSEEHTSELQSRGHLVCRLLLEKK